MRRARHLVAAISLAALAGCSASTAAPVAVTEAPTTAAPESTSPATTAAAAEDPIARPASVTLPVPTAAVPAPVAASTAPAAPVTVAVGPAAVKVAAPVAPPPAGAVDKSVVLGTIDIPKIGLHDTLRDGIALSTLDLGPGHWPGTAMPGQAGNVVVAAHRVSHTRPFYAIDKLVAGDEIVLTTGGASYTYRVTDHQIVTPDALWIVNQDPSTHLLTLFACHPPGSTQYRWVTRAELVSP